MKLISCLIEGTSALLQHRFGEMAEVESGENARRVHVKNELPRVAAERAAHRLPSGVLYFPGAAVAGLLREMGSSYKQKGSRKSLKYVLPAGVLVVEDAIPLLGKTDDPLTDFEVDSRPVVIRATQGRIMRHRPRLDEWRARFTLRINENVIDVATVRQLLMEGGVSNGIGDFRPQKGGPFGTFHLVSWEEVRSPVPAKAAE